MKSKFKSKEKAANSNGLNDSQLWKKFSNAKTSSEFAHHWLSLQCSYLPGVRRGVVVLGDPKTESYAPAAFWPQDSNGSMNLTRVADFAMEQKKGVLDEERSKNGKNGREEGKSSFMAYPFLIDESLHGVVAVEVYTSNEKKTQQAMRQLQWGSSWMEVMIRRQFTLKALPDQKRLSTVLELIASGLENEQFQKAANAVVTDMAVHLDCERVSLGFVKGKFVKVAALSHSAKFNKKSNLIRDIGHVMDEATDQRSMIVFPPTDEQTPLIHRLHADLNQQHGGGGVCTIPLSSGDKVFGALTFEKSQKNQFSEQDIQLCETASHMVGPILHIKRKEDRWILTKVLLSLKNLLGKLVGPRHLGWKMGLVIVAALVAFFYHATWDFRIAADTKIEGAVQRVVVAPMEGYIQNAFVRPGDIVKSGDLICELEDKDLVVEKFKWESQISQYQGQYRDALAKYNRSEIKILKAQLKQAGAKLKLIQKQLLRTRIYSPFEGIIVSGDLSQSLGAPVERGEVLYQLAPLNEYRVVLEVDERDIAEVQTKMHGELVLTGAVEENLPFVVKKITPVSENQEGNNFFRVEAQLLEHPDYLRPGMEGVGKINAGERKLIWILTREMINWFRLSIWTWWP
jgi:multidrug resistance efflux pump